MMTMKTKAATYVVLAIALGFMLTSTLPSTLVPEEEPLFLAGEETLLDSVKAPSDAESGAEAAEDSAAEAVPESRAFSEPEEATTSQETLGFSQYGMWAIDVMVALGVYFLAKRRFA
ncbi:MAG: hypothetical protein JSV27_00320 [Candidatus Bathyarchaeota archaeon]|nr:MAG: hypothetical protein JSV27_00320 [Candidatus Bathyarchaeota archaeon]